MLFGMLASSKKLLDNVLFPRFFNPVKPTTPSLQSNGILDADMPETTGEPGTELP